MMSILRHMSEEKQHSHIHISDTNRAKNEVRHLLSQCGPATIVEYRICFIISYCDIWFHS